MTVLTWGIGFATVIVTAVPPPSDSLHELFGLSAQRLLLADRVAAAKFGTGTPIEDRARELQVLDRAAALGGRAGLDRAETVAFFRAQIETGKTVQRGLFDRWTRHPAQAPAVRPDLATEVRPHLDRITVALIDRLAATDSLRAPTRRCRDRLAAAERAAVRRYRLDPLHSRALHDAVVPACSVPDPFGSNRIAPGGVINRPGG